MSPKLKSILAGIMAAGDLILIIPSITEFASSGDRFMLFLAFFFAIDLVLTIDYILGLRRTMKQQEELQHADDAARLKRQLIQQQLDAENTQERHRREITRLKEEQLEAEELQRLLQQDSSRQDLSQKL